MAAETQQLPQHLLPQSVRACNSHTTKRRGLGISLVFVVLFVQTACFFNVNKATSEALNLGNQNATITFNSTSGTEEASVLPLSTKSLPLENTISNTPLKVSTEHISAVKPTNTTINAAESEDCQQDCQDLFASNINRAIGVLSSSSSLTEDSLGSPRWRDCQCDELFCKPTQQQSTTAHPSPLSLSSCEWSAMAIAKMVELVESSDSCKPEFMRTFFPPEAWQGYRLSDYYHGIWKGKWDKWAVKYPHSLISNYHELIEAGGYRNNDKFDQLTVLYQAILKLIREAEDGTMKETNNANYTFLPPPDALVIHLRMGDVIDGALNTVKEMLTEQTYFYRKKTEKCNSYEPWECPKNPRNKKYSNAYVKPLSYFTDLLRQTIAKREQRPYSAVVLMGAAHPGEMPQELQGNATKSCIYTKSLQAYFATAMPLANVTLRIAQSPDSDVTFSSQAETFIRSGGGFSGLMGDLNDLKGGKKFKRKKKGGK